jgi:hypothetical protein
MTNKRSGRGDGLETAQNRKREENSYFFCLNILRLFANI